MDDNCYNTMGDTKTGGNLAAVLFKERDIRIENRPIPEPGRDEVQVRIRAAAVCATDVHFWEHGGMGNMKAKDPHVLCHEFSGVISKLGEGVTNVQVGDRVAIEPLRVCRKCDLCVEGRYNLCRNLVILSAPPNDGGLRQYLIQEAEHVFKIPDSISFAEAALIEPLSVGLHSCGLANVTVGDCVFIPGTGPVGICVLLAALAHGASNVVMTDFDQTRLEFAKKMGATHTFQVQKDVKVEDFAKEITEKVGRPISKAIECSGAEQAVHLSAEVLKPGGTMILVGFGPDFIKIPMITIIMKEIKIVGSVVYTGTWPTAIEMLSSGKINVAPLVTHRYTIHETQKAFEACHAGVGFRGIVECCPE